MSDTPTPPGSESREAGQPARDESPAAPPPFSAAGPQRETPPAVEQPKFAAPAGDQRPGAPPPIVPGPPAHQAGPGQQPPPRPAGPPPYGPPPGFGPYPPQGPRQGAPSGPPPGYGGGYGPTPPYGARPPYGAPDPRKVKRSRVPLIIGILVLLFVIGPGLLILVGGVLAAGTSSSSGFSLGAFFGDKVAVLEINGVIGQGDTFREGDTDRLRDIVIGWADDTSIKGMVIDINSPGGSVTPTWELFEAIQYFKDQGKPVYASMGETAASGGYLIAMAADEVYATKSTLTGSIGVIFSLMGYEELFDKIGLESRPIKSGEFKDIGSGTRPMTEAEKELLEELILNIYDQFFDLVLEHRTEAVRERLADAQGVTLSEISDEMVEAEIRRLCDGRIFSGEQAFNTGMVDQIGYRDDALSDMKAALGLSEETYEVMTPALPPPGLFGMMSRTATMIQSRTNGMPALEYRFAM